MFEKNCISSLARHPIAISGWPLNSESLFMIHGFNLVGQVGGGGEGGGEEEEVGEGGREREGGQSCRGRSSSGNSQSRPPCQRKVTKIAGLGGSLASTIKLGSSLASPLCSPQIRIREGRASRRG